MRSSVGSRFAHPAGFTLLKTPSHRQVAARRRLMAICAVLGLALASGLIGSLSASQNDRPGADAPSMADQASTGPFSYFPHQ
ncbi:hypothetical protein [Phenylobacterium soli]|uniref:Uncharacterized protein n=1 Tax=Phenylobacterium soli TaxID=2170551 RepID=A0A328AEW7_9CAUL|nr:hypothetical protein [Phenylobacterium soli]RAK53250.1 hypothetical protein DJ017_01245 [Phenylobacterium soli]